MQTKIVGKQKRYLRLLCGGMFLIMVCLMGRFGGDAAYAALSELDKEDPIYWHYYDADGNLKPEVLEDGPDFFSSPAMFGSTQVSNGKVYSPYYPRIYINSTNYYNTKNGRIAHGIDVSKWNENVDYKAVKNAGIEYVWIRCGNRYSSGGGMAEDPYFARNLKNALAEGMNVGVYVFSQAINVSEAEAEADLCLKMLGEDIYRLKLPIIMDVEYMDGSNKGRLYNAHLSKTKQTELILAFARRVTAKGSKAGVYCSRDFVNRNGGDKINAYTLEENGVSLWLARYSTSLGFSDTDYIAWQYDLGKVPGTAALNGKTDVNFIYEDSLPDMCVEDSYCSFVENSVPAEVKATRGSSSISLSWAAQKKAYGYVIQKKKSTAKSWTRLATIWNKDITSLKDSKVSDSYIYQYRVSAILSDDGTLRSNYSDSVYTMLKQDPPYLGQASGSQLAASANGMNAVKLNWDPVKGATYYQLCKKTDDGAYVTLAKPETVKYEDVEISYGATYTYRVRGVTVLPDGSKLYTSYSQEISYKPLPPRPVLTEVKTSGRKAISLSWSEVEEADGYRVYRKVAGGSYGNSYAHLTPDANGEIACSFLDENVKPGVIYYYKVRAYVNTGEYGRVYSEYCTAKTMHTVPAMIKTSALWSVRYNKLRINWEPAEGMDGYRIQMLNSDGSYSNVAEVDGKKHTYVITNLTCGKTYRFAVRAFVTTNGKRVYSQRDKVGLTAKPIPSQPAADYGSEKSGQVKVSWNSVAGASYYLVYYKSSENGSRKVVANVKVGNPRSVQVKGVKGTTCYYAVRACRVVNGKKIYGKYSWEAVAVK